MTALGTQAMALADAARFVVIHGDPKLPPSQREAGVRLVLRGSTYRASVLRKAALNLRNDPDGLRQLQAARNVLLHPATRQEH